MVGIETRTFSPKELAQVVGVSESSIKRWVDDGLIGVMRTAGGHRRILAREALRFVRAQGMRILRPDLLGLPDITGLPPEARDGEFSGEVLFQLLRQGEAAKARGIIASRYLNGTSLADLFDGPMAEALAELGELWKHGTEGIYAEHMATTICIEAINQVRLLIPPPGDDVPRAVGGAPSGDPYLLPSLMAAAVLADAGFNEVNLGPNTPAPALLHAVEVQRPHLVWMALNAPQDAKAMDDLIEQLFTPLRTRKIEIVLGGRQAVLGCRRWPDFVRVMRSMSDLAAYVSAF